MVNIPCVATWLQTRCKVQIVVLPISQNSELTWLSPNSSMCFCMPSSCFFNCEFWNKWHQVHCNSSKSTETKINFIWPKPLWNPTSVLRSWSTNTGKCKANCNTTQIAQGSAESFSAQKTMTLTCPYNHQVLKHGSPCTIPNVHDSHKCWSNHHQHEWPSSIKALCKGPRGWKPLLTAGVSTYDMVNKDMLGLHNPEDEGTGILQDIWQFLPKDCILKHMPCPQRIICEDVCHKNLKIVRIFNP